MAVELSKGTRKRLHVLFHGEDLELASDLLESDCADNLPLWDDASPTGLERIRYAALKLSDGDLGKLDEAVRLSLTDWRDTLVIAEFGDDPSIHLQWRPVKNNPD